MADGKINIDASISNAVPMFPFPYGPGADGTCEHFPKQGMPILWPIKGIVNTNGIGDAGVWRLRSERTLIVAMTVL